MLAWVLAFGAGVRRRWVGDHLLAAIFVTRAVRFGDAGLRDGFRFGHGSLLVTGRRFWRPVDETHADRQGVRRERELPAGQSYGHSP